MIKVSVLYPNSESARFDIEYYRDTHMPLVRERLGQACRRTSIEQGLAGAAPGEAPAYAAMGHLYFDSLSDFETAFPPHAEELMGDIPNFTNIQPTVQISQVVE